MYESARGFTLVELLVAVALASVVAGAALAIAGDVQRAHGHVLDDTAVQQETRYALDWITRLVAAAGSNAYGIEPSAPSTCAGVPFAALHLDPDGNGVDDDLRLEADVNPANGVIGGDLISAGLCDEAGEDVTIAIDRDERVITRWDATMETGALPATDAVFTDLRFTYLTLGRGPATIVDDIAFVRIAVTAESRATNPVTGVRARFTSWREVPVRRR